MKIAYLGPEGSYTEEAALEKFPDATLVPYASIPQVFVAVATQSVVAGVVPTENIIQGPVTETQDGLYEHHRAVGIKDMLVMSITHALGASGSAREIREILSKDQALRQCSCFLETEYPDARLVEVDSTSAAVETIVKNGSRTQAAIASPRALASRGLPLLAERIGDREPNKTRFVVLGGAHYPDSVPTGADATAFVIYPPGDRVGILEEILGVISRDHGLSLSSIHSRPDQRGAFRFYMELEGHRDDPAVRSCLDALRQKLADDFAEIFVFGSYPQCPFEQPAISTIGIVGGTGKMGNWFQKLFRQAGYEVMVNGHGTGTNLKECVRSAQAVLINVPIEHAVEMAGEVCQLLQPGQVVIDNTSIKGPVMKALLDAAPAGVEVLGMHTIFGPREASLRKRNVVFTRTDASNDLAREFERIFYKHGAIISYADAATHDQQMAFHQNLEHFSKIALARVMTQTLHNVADARSYSSPNSRASLRTMARVLNIDPELLVQIQKHNTAGADVTRCFVETCSELLALIEAGDFDTVRQWLADSRSALGDGLLEDLQGEEQ